MKFNFKIQQYQTDAVEAVARVFVGQGFHARAKYRRDVGKVSNEPRQMTMGMLDDFGEDLNNVDDTGYKNELVELSDEQLLQNIQQLQNENNIKILLANSINKTLENMDLIIEEGKNSEKRNKAIDIDTPRIVCLSPFTIADEEAPKAKVGEAESVLTHIRNAFAHGNTYYFDNKYVLFEDKDQRGGITARILMPQQSLLDWIRLIDHESRYYTIVNVQQDEEGN